MHANQKLTEIKAQDDRLDVIFQDGSTKHFDAIIGADGIFSKVRKYVVGEAVQYQASPGGFWDCRLLVPYEKACTMIGDQYFELDREYGWIGNSSFIMHNILENRTMVQFVVSAVDGDLSTDRERPLTKELLTKTLKDWPDAPIAKGVIDVSPSETLFQERDLSIHSCYPSERISRLIPNGSTRQLPLTLTAASASSGMPHMQQHRGKVQALVSPSKTPRSSATS